MATRNVFVSMLSKLYNPATNYYYSDSYGKRSYFTGAFTNEPGGKYILAKEKINKMVIIGSDETIDSRKPNSPDRLEQVSVAYPPEKAKALDYFKYRLALFARGKECPPEDYSDISPERKEKLCSMTAAFMNENGFADEQTWFDTLTDQPGMKEALVKKIQADIETSYAGSNDFNGYEKDNPLSKLPELSQLEEGKVSAQEMIKELKKIQDEAFETLLEKEQFLLLGVTSVENRILRLEKEQLEKQNAALSSAINKLREYNIRLQRELSDIRSRRGNKEINYIKQSLYEKLADSRKLTCLPDQLKTEITFVPLMRGGLYNISGIFDAIYEGSNPEEKIDLYIDVQGGDRTDTFVHTQILSVVGNEKDGQINIREIISSDFFGGNFANRMRDETRRYRISDMVSGMTAFTKYGKVSVLINFFDDPKQNMKGMAPLLSAMEEIDQAITLSNVNGLERGITNLREALKKAPPADTEASELFEILKDGIERDYGKLLDDKDGGVDTAELIRWAFKKDMIMQSLTIIEARLPRFLSDRRLVWYDRNKEELLLKEKEWDEGADSSKLRDPDRAHYYLKGYLIYAKKYKENIFRRYNNRYENKRMPYFGYIVQQLLKVPSKDKDLVGAKTSVSDNNIKKLSALLDDYQSVCDMRNKVCHPTGERDLDYGKAKEQVKTLIKDLDKLINTGESN